MKNIRRVFILLTLAVVVILMWGIRHSDDHSSTFSRGRGALDGEAGRLVEHVRGIIASGDLSGLEGATSEIMDRYTGDPRPLILEFSDLLNHDNAFVRVSIAEIFLQSNIETESAVDALRKILRSKDPVVYDEKDVAGVGEFGPGDLRLRAANTISLYGISGAADEIWNLYQSTKSGELISPLRRLNDPRIVMELKESALRNPGAIPSMRLIGEYRYKEALPDLKRRYDDKSLGSDLHFVTLFPLWRITGDEKYFNEFAAYFPTGVPIQYLAIGGEKEHLYLINQLKSAQSDNLYKATMALHLRFKDDLPIKDLLVDYYRNLKGSNWKDPVLARRLVGSINDPELTRISKEYEEKYPTGYFNRDVIYKKDWRYPEWQAPLFME